PVHRTGDLAVAGHFSDFDPLLGLDQWVVALLLLHPQVDGGAEPGVDAERARLDDAQHLAGQAVHARIPEVGWADPLLLVSLALLRDGLDDLLTHDGSDVLCCQSPSIGHRSCGAAFLASSSRSSASP